MKRIYVCYKKEKELNSDYIGSCLQIHMHMIVFEREKKTVFLGIH